MILSIVDDVSKIICHGDYARLRHLYICFSGVWSNKNKKNETACNFQATMTTNTTVVHAVDLKEARCINLLIPTSVKNNAIDLMH